MKFLKKLRKEPRLVISFLLFVFFFLPWVKDITNVSMDFGEFGNYSTGDVEGGIYSGFDLCGVTYSSLLIPLIPILLIIAEVLPALKKYRKAVYPILSIVGVLASFIIIIWADSIITAGNTSEINSKSAFMYGFWLTIIAYVAQIIVSLVIDFKINKKSLQSQGIKGTIGNITNQVTSTVVEMKDNFRSGDIQSAMKEQIGALGSSIAQEISESTKECPVCQTKVLVGKKFCSKCGHKFEIQANKDLADRNNNDMEQVNIQRSIPVDSKEIIKEAVEKCTNCSCVIPHGKSYCPDCGRKVEVIKTCTACGVTLLKGKKFCAECGTAALQESNELVCSNCGEQIKQGRKFCSNCGFSLEKKKRKCGTCSTELDEGKKFCHECGTKYSE